MRRGVPAAAWWEAVWYQERAEQKKKKKDREINPNHKQNRSWIWANVTDCQTLQMPCKPFLCARRGSEQKPYWVLNSTPHFLLLGLKIGKRVLKSNALKSDTGRCCPAPHSHPWVSFVLGWCARPVLEARALWHHATRGREGRLFKA